MRPNTGLDSFEDRFADIVNSEWSQRENKKFNRLLKQATLKYLSADLDSSIYEPERQLNTLNFFTKAVLYFCIDT